MSKGLLENAYNPDVLSCLANLSNDEVFTAPDVVNEMLDTLPQDLFRNPDTTFLEPACKTGVFLREIAKRLIDGLEPQFPNLEERLNHIFKKQLFGISITELTSLLTRRSLYCSKWPNGEYSIIKFDTPEGNIKYRKIEHTWKNGNCIFCGANESVYKRSSDLETYAYQFIHTNNPEEIFNMKFDVIIGNPPYQLTTGGAQAQATPLYHKFVQQAKKLNPRYLSMIIPSRWFTGGFGLDSFRQEMLKDKRLRIIHDYLNASECFPGVEIKGGVCYFLWDREYNGDCEIITHEGNNIISSMKRNLIEDDLDIFIRYNEAVPIYKKISNLKEEKLTKIISSQRPFGLPTNFKDFSDTKQKKDDIHVYANKKEGYIDKNYPIEKNIELINKYKVLTPKAIGNGEGRTDWVKPILAEPNSVCTETYIILGAFNTETEAKNLISYTQTKFFHFILTLKKNTQDALAKVYSLIPLQDFHECWNDEKLYKKYKLDKNEVKFIQSMIREDIGNGGEK